MRPLKNLNQISSHCVNQVSSHCAFFHTSESVILIPFSICLANLRDAFDLIGLTKSKEIQTYPWSSKHVFVDVSFLYKRKI